MPISSELAATAEEIERRLRKDRTEKITPESEFMLTAIYQLINEVNALQARLRAIAEGE
jgi:hypothetical protein